MPYKKTKATSVDDIVGKPDVVKVPKVSPLRSTEQNSEGQAKVSAEEKILNQVQAFGSETQARRDDKKQIKEESDTKEPEKEASMPVQSPAASAPAPTPITMPTSIPAPFQYVPAYQRQIDNGPTQEVHGILDVQPEGHGFLRPKFIPSSRDIYISQSQIRKFMLRPGDLVAGMARPPKDTERYFGLLRVDMVNDVPAEESLRRPWFDDLTPIYPKKQITLATGKQPFSTRIIDLVSPIGFGQRGMVVSPPKAGKTTILKEMAAGISQNFPKVHIMAALIGERPEEVTDIAQSVHGDVVASNFDEPPDNQTRVAEITLDRAKRLVEMGVNVVILLDSVTRLARAYNLSIEPSGRTLTGGFDPAALWPAKRFFGAARNCQEGGSLTIIGTALVETGSRMDDLIFEEFKGTGNMELHLDRKLADRRIFPAINVERSGTRQEELLLSEKEYKNVVTMRRMIDMLNPEERTQILIERLSKAASNEEFLDSLGKG